ncbi:hypothetical protein FHG87_001182 [Trinorchestia longiramus]|nr:hypothetical protein FHG87_001182 [Trinorchestia longiramus]
MKDSNEDASVLTTGETNLASVAGEAEDCFQDAVIVVPVDRLDLVVRDNDQCSSCCDATSYITCNRSIKVEKEQHHSCSHDSPVISVFVNSTTAEHYQDANTCKDASGMPLELSSSLATVFMTTCSSSASSGLSSYQSPCSPPVTPLCGPLLSSSLHSASHPVHPCFPYVSSQPSFRDTQEHLPHTNVKHEPQSEQESYCAQATEGDRVKTENISDTSILNTTCEVCQLAGSISSHCSHDRDKDKLLKHVGNSEGVRWNCGSLTSNELISCDEQQNLIAPRFQKLLGVNSRMSACCNTCNSTTSVLCCSHIPQLDPLLADVPSSVLAQSLSASTPPLDFALSDWLRGRLGSIVVNTRTCLANGVSLSRIETHNLLIHSAGLVMTSPLDDAVFEPSQRHRSRPTDLAHALTPTLHNYDQMSEPSVPRPCDASSNIPDYLRNAKTGGDGKIMNRLWCLASSYMPAAYADSTHTTPATSVHSTPKRTMTRKDGPGERWERSVERWDNSPKMARSREKMNAQARNTLNRDLSASRKCHARSDSGSSLGSLSEVCVGSQDTLPNNTKLTEKSEDTETQTFRGSSVSSDSTLKEVGVRSHDTKNESSCEDLKRESKSSKKSDDNADRSRGTDGTSKVQTSDNLSAIDEEDLSLQTNGQARTFFSRNAPERLSSLLKKGVGGADEKLRGLWRRGVSKSGSKDSLRSNPSSSGSLVSSPSSEKTPCASPVETDSRTPTRSPKKKKSPQSSGTKVSLKLINNTTDKELFLKGEQPRLFQANSPEQYETPPGSPLKSNPLKGKTQLKSQMEPVTVQVCPGRDKVILGDPLGALDSPTNSPSASPKSSKKYFDPLGSVSDESVNNSILVTEDDPTLRPAAIMNHAKASFASRLNPDFHVQVSTVRRTVLPPLSGSLSDGRDVNQSDESPEELSDSFIHVSRSTVVTQSSSSSSSLSSDPASARPSVIPWSITPIGSPFSVPVPMPMNSSHRSATIPRSSTEKSSPLKTLPPLAPKTPSRVTPQSSGGPSRPSRSIHRQLNQQAGQKHSGRSNSANSSPSMSAGCGVVANEDADDELGRCQGEDRRSTSGDLCIAGRTSNSLTSLSSAVVSGGMEDSITHRGHRRRGSDLAPRQAATLESNYTPSVWSQKWISEQSQQLNGAALSSLANSGLQKLGLFRENYLDPTMSELLSSKGFSGRKNELLSGGLSSLRSSAVSAVSSISKKVRQSISANNTPVRAGAGTSAIVGPCVAAPYAWRSVDGGGGEEEDALDGLFSRRRESAPADTGTAAVTSSVSGSEELLMSHTLISSLSTGGFFSSQAVHGDKTGQLFDAFCAGPAWEARGPYCLGVQITSCSKCHNCHTLLYDEEIMAGWTPDHSNLNTKCRYCERYTVPVLTITLYDMLHLPKHEAPGMEAEQQRSSATAGQESNRSSSGTVKDEIFKTIRSKCTEQKPITVAYLSPLVLRKELESMLSHEGDEVLTQPSCPEKHPILYWNMLWYFTRLGLPSQLSGLCLAAKLATDGHLLHPSWYSGPAPNPPSGSGSEQGTTVSSDTAAGVGEKGSINTPRVSQSASLQDLDKNKTDVAPAPVVIKTELNGNIDELLIVDENTNSLVRQSSEVNVSVANNLVSSKPTIELPSTDVGLKSGSESAASEQPRSCPPTLAPSKSPPSTSDAKGPSIKLGSSKKREDGHAHTGARYPDWRNVFVICMWDCPLYHQEVGPPLYLQLRQRGNSSRQVRALVHQPLLINENVLQSLLTLLLIDDLHNAMKMFAQELRKRPTNLQQRRLPLYRDLLLLASDAFSHPALNMVSFEQRYRAAYDSLDPSIAGLLTPADSAPPLAANFAKRCFPPLSL